MLASLVAQESHASWCLPSGAGTVSIDRSSTRCGAQPGTAVDEVTTQECNAEAAAQPD